MNLPTHEIVLLDKDGNPHKYLICLHPATEGMKVHALLVAHAAPAITSFLKELAATKEGLTALVQKGAGALAVGAVAVQNLPIEQIGGSLRDVLLSVDIPKLIPLLFKNTYRDDQPMGDMLKFDAAYSGNYEEMDRAIYEVIRVNGFFPRFNTFLPKRGAVQAS